LRERARKEQKGSERVFLSQRGRERERAEEGNCPFFRVPKITQPKKRARKLDEKLPEKQTQQEQQHSLINCKSKQIAPKLNEFGENCSQTSGKKVSN